MRDLDYSPLDRPVGPRQRLRALGTNNLNVAGATVAVLLIVVPAVVLVALVATGNATDGGGLAVLGLCLAGGVYTVVDVLRRAGPAGGLVAFARANGLTHLGGSIATHYAGSQFADGSHAVHQGVRTEGACFVEVGDRFPTTLPRGSRRPNQATLYLRARLGVPATYPSGGTELITPELHARLTAFAGDYVLEVSGDELTLLGSRGLGVGKQGRVEEAFALVDELATRATTAAEACAGKDVLGVEPTISGIPVPVSKPPAAAAGRPLRPLAVVGWTVALLVVGPILFAVVMSILDDGLRGNRVGAGIVVTLLVGILLAVTARGAKALMTPRRRDRG